MNKYMKHYGYMLFLILIILCILTFVRRRLLLEKFVNTETVDYYLNEIIDSKLYNINSILAYISFGVPTYSLRNELRNTNYVKFINLTNGENFNKILSLLNQQLEDQNDFTDGSFCENIKLYLDNFETVTSFLTGNKPPDTSTNCTKLKFLLSNEYIAALDNLDFGETPAIPETPVTPCVYTGWSHPANCINCVNTRVEIRNETTTPGCSPLISMTPCAAVGTYRVTSSGRKGTTTTHTKRLNDADCSSSNECCSGKCSKRGGGKRGGGKKCKP